MSTMILAQNQVMPAVAFANRFVAGEAAAASYALKQFTAIGASVTLANGAGVASQLLVVDDDTPLTVGAYYQIGSSDPVMIDWIDPTAHLAALVEARTWSDNAQVKPVTVATGSITGLTLNSATGALAGTPTTLGTTASATFPAGTLVVRMTDASGLFADSSPFDIQIDAPPVPPLFTGLISSEAWVLNTQVSLDWGQYFSGATVFSLIGTLPTALVFDTATGTLSGTLTQIGEFGPFTVRATNSAGHTDSNAVTITVEDVVTTAVVPLLRTVLPGVASGLIEDAGLTLDPESDTAYSEDVPSGYVEAQYPPAFAVVPLGTAVKLTISLGPVPLPPPDVVSVTVRALDDGYYGGYARRRLDTFEIFTPLDFSPYWMVLVDTPPDSWLPLLEVFDPDIDRQILKQPAEPRNIPEPFRGLLS